MRRRSLLAAAGLTAPATLLAPLDAALASTPDATGSTTPLDTRLTTARGDFDAGRHAVLLKALPGLLADAHAAARSRHEMALARLSTTYTLTAQVLTKIGQHDRARLSADRAATYAEWSASPLVAAAAARELSIVLRHLDQPEAAERHIRSALSQVESTGLRTGAQASAYAQMLCTTAYSAARQGDRGQALTMIAEASRAARGLPDQAPAGRLFPLTPAAADLYAVGVHWALGDGGKALDAGKNLKADQFPTAERRSRMHTDLARAHWLLSRPEQTADQLLAAMRYSPAEVRDRPAIRSIVTELRQRHPRVTGVRELAAATGIPA